MFAFIKLSRLNFTTLNSKTLSQHFSSISRLNSKYVNANYCYIWSAPRQLQNQSRTLFLYTKVLTRDKLPFEVDSNVHRDVLLYKYDQKLTLFHTISYFGFLQWIFWGYMCYLAATVFKDDPSENRGEIFKDEVKKSEQESIPSITASLLDEFKKYGTNKYSKGISFLFFSIGNLLFFISLILPLRSVRYVILMKGGQKLRLVTLTPIGTLRKIEFPINSVTLKTARNNKKPYATVKVKNRWFYFLLDRSGEYLQPKLFDNTVAIRRDLLQ